MTQKKLNAVEMRKRAEKESSLPYSFTYKIRKAFLGEKCPICNRKMGVAIIRDDDPIVIANPKPSIQHNIPISLGGKHELSNISVICESCNCSLRQTPTGKLNNDLVVKKWNEIINVSKMDPQVRLG